MSEPIQDPSDDDVDRIIRMAWEDRTSFDAIREQFGLTPGDVIKLMRRELEPASFKRWRKRTSGRQTKHGARFSETGDHGGLLRFRSKSQRGR